MFPTQGSFRPFRFVESFYSVTVSSVCRLAVESSPAQTSNVLDSTTHTLVCGLQNSSSSLPSGNVSVCVSPGLRATRLNPLSWRTGREADPQRWWM